MKLISHPSLKGNNLPQIPNEYGVPSGYLLIALVQDNSEIYAAFTNLNKSGLWIEKYAAPLIQRNFFNFGDLCKIEDNEEWTTIRNFLLKRKVI